MSEIERLFWAELLGTLILILLGDGVVAAVLLKKSKAENSGWIVITTGWAIAVLCGIVTSMAFGGPGAINPVGPIADLVAGKIAAATALAMISGEFVGAFLGAILVWLHYFPHWAATEDASAKLAVFCTAPAIRSPAANLISEIIGAFVLIFVAGAIGKVILTNGLQPPLVGALVWGIGLSLGGTTGYAINPARDLSPRMAHQLLPISGKGTSDWGYAWIPVAGPIVGGVLAAMLTKWLTTMDLTYSPS